MTMTRTTVRRPRRRENVEMAHHRVEVTASHRISPQMVRITLGGPSLADFVDDGPDQRCKVFLPRPGQTVPILPSGSDWYQVWRDQPAAVRAVMRTYTVRRSRPELGEIDIDFVLHDEAGPASAWAAQARVGDRVGLFGPRAEYVAPVGADEQLLIGDATALPAIAAIVEALPMTARARVLIEVDGPAEELTLSGCSEVKVHWVHLDGAAPGRRPLLLEALRATPFVSSRTSAWIAGEAAMVRSVRRHLVCERGLSASDVQFMGYWRLGSSIDPD